MRIDLPCCGFKKCRYQFDGNCINRIKYDDCEFQRFNEEIELRLLNNTNPYDWIPVSDRLPGESDYRPTYEVEDGAVLWTNDAGLVGMGYYYASTGEWSDVMDNGVNVVAWARLPEPYKENK